MPICHLPSSVPVVVLVLAGGVALIAACARPALQYPRCESDADCRSEHTGRFVDQHCVFGTCQTCADDTHCGPGESCHEGRCGTRPVGTGSDVPALLQLGCREQRHPVRFEAGSVDLDERSKHVLDALRRCRVAEADVIPVISGVPLRSVTTVVVTHDAGNGGRSSGA
jgi:hypothetical protein